MRKHFCLILLVISAVLFLNNCKSDRNKDALASDELNYEYPFEAIGDTLKADVNDKSELFPLREEVLESFLQQSKDFKGRKWTAKVSFPKEWGVKCVERLQEGKELWEICSQSREFIYLVTTSGYGTQRILDVLPVAISVTNQNNDDLETENWETIRLPDGQFQTVKQYEWIHSMTKVTKQAFLSNPEKYHRKSKYTEQFLINDDGRFEISETVDTMPDYKAVIFFFNPNDKPLLWDEDIPRLQAFCEENGVLFEEVSQNYNRVTVRDFELTFSMETDITPYTNDIQSGMVMMTKGEEPKVVHFGSFEYMQMEIRRYFKLRNLADNPE